MSTDYTIRYWRLENHTSRDAFYEVCLQGDTVAIRYGKMGTSGTTKIDTHESADKAQATALRQVYAKQSKQYEMIHDDLVVDVGQTTLNETNLLLIRNTVNRALREGNATPREQALNYIEGFIEDCNEYLVRAKSGEIVESEFAALTERWEELKDKFDSAETMMDMVKMRALKRV